MTRRLFISLIALGLVTTACGAGSGAANHASLPRLQSSELVAANVEMVRPSANVHYGALADGNRQLGYELAQKLVPQAADGNLVFSPASLAIVFAMLREGALGPTAAAIDSVIHLPANRRAAYDGLVTALGDPGAGNSLDLANAMFVAPGFPVRPAYLKTVKAWYGAGVHQTSFPQPALHDINAYVAAQTHGLIPRLLDHLDASDVLALINAVYLNAKWQIPFSASETTHAPFTTSSGAQVSATMMSNGDTALDYASGPGWRAVRIPYRGDRLSMWVMLPSGHESPVGLLSPEVLSTADAGFTRIPVQLSLPRWNIESGLDLGDTLKSMGLGSIFEPGGFGALSPDLRLAVDQVAQKATIAVGENGTVAAVATGAVAQVTSGQALSGPVFNVNRPFAFAIIDNTTGTPVFEGTVSDPS